MNSKKMDEAGCECGMIHKNTVGRVQKEMPREETFYELSELFKVLGDQTRVKILFALSLSEMCVCDIAYLLEVTQSAVSHQLRILKNSRLVKYRKKGRIVYYSLDDEHVNQIFDQGLHHINEK